MAATGDHHAADRLLLAADLRHELPDVVLGGEEEDLVPFLDDGVALGLDAAAAAVDGDHTRLGVRDVLAQVAQFLADQQSALACGQADEPYPAIGEVQHL